MLHERGFTLTEMTAALLVLSLAMISLGEITSSLFRSWGISQTSHSKLTDVMNVLDQIHDAERKIKSEFDPVSHSTLAIEDGVPLLLAIPKIDRPATCEYDLVGRRCR